MKRGGQQRTDSQARGESMWEGWLIDDWTEGRREDIKIFFLYVVGEEAPVIRASLLCTL